jgi:putative oxidoreductase
MSAGVPPPSVATAVLRGTVALIFLAHAVVRLANGSVPQFGAFLDRAGFTPGIAWVLGISTCEIVAGTLLIAGLCVRGACAVLAAIVLGGIVLIHARLGWFVGEHGTGGMEFSVLLCAALLAVAAEDRGRRAGIVRASVPR